MSLIPRYMFSPAVIGMLFLTTTTFAQTRDDVTVDGDVKPMISITDIQPVLEPVNDYTGTLAERTTLTGDWGGMRQDMLESGVAANASLTQTFRVVASGGEETDDTAYNGLVDFGLTFDTAKLGLWPGGYASLTGQSAFASGQPLRDGAVSPSDYNAVFPTLDRPTTELMEYYLIQGLGESLGVMLGRVNPVAWDRNRFAYDPRTQFMNGAISQQLLVGGLVSFSTYTASVMWKANDHLNILGGIYDPVIRPGEFDTPFEEVGFFTVLELESGHGGTARLLGVYDASEGTAFDNPRLILDKARGSDAETKPDNWMFGLNFEQYLWKPEHNADEQVGTKKLDFSTSSFGFQQPGLGVFGRAAVLPESRNAFSRSASLGLAGRGIVPGRPLDRMGVGGYWLKASGDLAGLTGKILDDETGVEVFYNYAIAPWLQASLDLQYSETAITTGDDSFVIGLRLFTQF